MSSLTLLPCPSLAAWQDHLPSRTPESLLAPVSFTPALPTPGAGPAASLPDSAESSRETRHRTTPPRCPGLSRYRPAPHSTSLRGEETGPGVTASVPQVQGVPSPRSRDHAGPSLPPAPQGLWAPPLQALQAARVNLPGWLAPGASEPFVPVTGVVPGTRPSGGYSWGPRLLQGSHLQAGTPAGCPALTHSHCPAPPSFPAIPVANQNCWALRDSPEPSKPSGQPPSNASS